MSRSSQPAGNSPRASVPGRRFPHANSSPALGAGRRAPVGGPVIGQESERFAARLHGLARTETLASGREEREPATAVREPVATIASPVAKNASPGTAPVAAIVSPNGPPFASPSSDDCEPLQLRALPPSAATGPDPRGPAVVPWVPSTGTAADFPCCASVLPARAATTTPVGPPGAPLARFPGGVGLPRLCGGSAPTTTFRGLLGVHS